MDSYVRHVAPVPADRAEGLLGEVYGQAGAELGRVGPVITMLSPAPELLAPVWALLRESLLVGGPAERRRKEVVASVVAARNGCVCDADAHTVLPRAAGEAAGGGRVPGEFAPLARWAAAPRVAGPFPASAAPRFLGTVLVFELITRLARALTVRASPSSATASGTGRAAVAADPATGLSLPLLERVPSWLRGARSPEPAWAAGSPVGAAYAALRARAAYGAMLLSDHAAEEVRRAVAAYGPDLGERLPPLDAAASLGRQAGLGARLATAAALAPGRVETSDVAAWRGEEFSDHCVVHLLTFGAMIAVEVMQDECNETEIVDA